MKDRSGHVEKLPRIGEGYPGPGSPSEVRGLVLWSPGLTATAGAGDDDVDAAGGGVTGLPRSSLPPPV